MDNFVLFDARKEDRCPHLVFPFPHPDSSPPRNYFLLCLCGKVCETAFRVSSVRVPGHGRSAFSYLESPEFIGVQGLLRVKKKKRALLRIPVMRVLRISNMYPARAPSILPSPVPGRMSRRIVPARHPGRSGSCLLALGDSRLARGGSGPWASRQHGCSYSFHAPYYSPYGLDPSVSHGHGPGLLDHDQRSPVPSNGTL